MVEEVHLERERGLWRPSPNPKPNPKPNPNPNPNPNPYPNQVHLERAMDGVKQGVMVGHLHTVSEVNTQLKAMCFRQDSMALPLREPLQVRAAAPAIHA